MTEPLMTIELAAERHEEALIIEGKGSETIRCYAYDLKGFMAAMLERGIVHVADVTAEHVQAHIAGLQVSNGTRARKVAALRSLFHALVIEGHITTNPAAGLNFTRNPATATVPDEALVARILEAYPVGTDRRAIVELAAMGLTTSEISGLDLGDLDARSGLLTVRAHKGTHEVTLSASALCALETYIRQGRQDREDAKTNPAIFPGMNAGRRISRQAVWSCVRAACPKGFSVTPRDLRRLRAVTMLRMGFSVADVAAQLGHECDLTTARYARLSRKGAA